MSARLERLTCVRDHSTIVALVTALDQTQMPFALNFYHDQFDSNGSTSSPLPAAHRLLYVRHGEVVINGQAMASDTAIYCDAPVSMKSAAEWAHVGRALELAHVAGDRKPRHARRDPMVAAA
jgi:hypothetical protein